MALIRSRQKAGDVCSARLPPGAASLDPDLKHVPLFWISVMTGSTPTCPYPPRRSPLPCPVDFASTWKQPLLLQSQGLCQCAFALP